MAGRREDALAATALFELCETQERFVRLRRPSYFSLRCKEKITKESTLPRSDLPLATRAPGRDPHTSPSWLGCGRRPSMAAALRVLPIESAAFPHGAIGQRRDGVPCARQVSQRAEWDVSSHRVNDPPPLIDQTPTAAEMPARRAAHMDVRRVHPRQDAECARRNLSFRSRALLHLGEGTFFWLLSLCQQEK